ncbi:MAG: TonB-dependent receptor [Bacteroidales bacterium]|jgi:TonB-linked SusC/RagA family outer membrane protein|nr:TonB-dependent receptor [Bacteroidales bacterium]
MIFQFDMYLHRQVRQVRTLKFMTLFLWMGWWPVSAEMFPQMDASFPGKELKDVIPRDGFNRDNVPYAVAVGQAQGFPVTGTITDAGGESMPGVNIVVKGTMTGVISDLSGNYTIQVPGSDAVLVFSFVGYATQEITVGDRTNIPVTLAESAQEIEEVVVVGYGTQKKVNLTGAISVVNMDKALGDRPVTSVASAIQGAVPGLQITGGASPGEAKKFNIRGTTSITTVDNSSPGPLVLVDNVECRVDLVNPEDIETITVLKDAASSAIYGARAAYGVILITTKKGKKNSKAMLNYNNNFAFSKAVNRIEQAPVAEVVKAFNEFAPGGNWYADGQNFSVWSDFISDYQANPSAFEAMAASNGEYFNSQWGIYTPKTGVGAGKYFYLKDNHAQNDIFDNYGFQQIHNLSALGGSDKITYRLSLGYLNNNGPLKTKKDTYERINVAGYIGADLTPWLNQSLDIRYTRGTRVTLETLSPYTEGIYNTRYHNFLPGADLWTPAGNTAARMMLTSAPENFLLHGTPDNLRSENPRIFSRTLITPFKGFEGVVEYTYDGQVYDIKSQPSSIEMRSPQMIDNPYTDPAYRNDKSFTRYNSLNIYATYSVSWTDKHHFKLMGGFSQERTYYELLWTSRKNAINAWLPSISGSTGEINAGDDFSDYTIRSGFFRFNYNYANRYLLEINGRYDGSSKFPTESRFGFFPSVSLGWQLANENFMTWTNPWLNEWKLRASWGEIGNQAIANYQYLPGMEIVLKSDWIYDGRNPTTLKTPGIVRGHFTWERVATLDFGTDISLLNNRLQATFDWYQRETKGMLGPASEYPAAVGAKAPLQNVADLRTRGWEFAVNWREKIGNWGYSVGFNLSDYVSVITRYRNDAGLFSEYRTTDRFYEGMTFGEVWGYRFDRFYTVDDFVDTNAWTLKDGVTSIKGVTNLRPGDIMWKNLSDKTGRNEINDGTDNLDDPGDRAVIANETPRFQYGITAGVNYMGIDLSVFMQGTGKRDYWFGNTDIIFPMRGTNNTGENGTIYRTHVNNYQQVADLAAGNYALTNPNAFYPRIYSQPGEAVNSSNRRISDRYMLDASYLRVKNITLSYTFPQNIIQPLRLSSARVFVSAEDVLTFSRLPKGVDPERMSWGYPFYAVYSFGINLTF